MRSVRFVAYHGRYTLYNVYTIHVIHVKIYIILYVYVYVYRERYGPVIVCGVTPVAVSPGEKAKDRRRCSSEVGRAGRGCGIVARGEAGSGVTERE